MANEEHRYSISRTRRLIDSKPMERGGLPRVWVPDQHEWIDLELTFGEHVDTVPISDQEAQRFMETGEISSMRTSLLAGTPDEFSEE